MINHAWVNTSTIWFSRQVSLSLDCSSPDGTSMQGVSSNIVSSAGNHATFITILDRFMRQYAFNSVHFQGNTIAF